MRWLIPLMIALSALTGCKRNEEAYIRGVVASVGPVTLVNDAAALASKPEGSSGHPVQPSTLPASFQSFKPLETWRYDSQFVIVTRRHLQHRVGVIVQPVNYPKPQSTGGVRYTPIAPGIFYYES